MNQARRLLDVLLAPHTIHFVDTARSRAATAFAAATTRLEAGSAELTVVPARGRTVRAIPKTAPRPSHAAICLDPDLGALHCGFDSDASAMPFVLGGDAGILSPVCRVTSDHGPAVRLPAGLLPDHGAINERPCILLTDGAALVAHLLGPCLARPLKIRAVIFGANLFAEPAILRQLLADLEQQAERPIVMLAVRSKMALGCLVAAGASSTDVVCLAAGAGRQVANVCAPPETIATATAAAEAHNVVVVHTAEELIEVTWLLAGARVHRHRGRVTAFAGSASEADLLREDLKSANLTAAAGVSVQVSSVAARAAQAHAVARAARVPHTAILLGPSLAETIDRHRLPPHVLSLAPDANRKSSRSITAQGLRAIGHVARGTAIPALRGPGARPRVQAARARQLLDRYPSALLETHVRALLGCYTADIALAELVRSASAAAAVAMRLGFPVSLHPVGRAVTVHVRRTTSIQAVDSVAAVRAAFGAVIHGCDALSPGIAVEGVLVQSASSRPDDGTIRAVEISLLWASDEPLAMMSVAGGADDSASPRSAGLSCPCSHEAAAATAALVRQWLATSASSSPHLGDVLWRLSWLGADLVERMQWLQLSLVLPGSAKQRPAIVSALGAQAEGFRAPWS